MTHDTAARPRPDTIESRVEAMLIAAFTAVAPDIVDELGTIDPDVDLWNELELDSMDHLGVIEQLAATLGQDIPEADYPHLVTLRQLRCYLASRGS